MFKFLQEFFASHKHDWGNWELDREVKVFEYEWDARPFRRYVIQKRQCKTCKLVEYQTDSI